MCGFAAGSFRNRFNARGPSPTGLQGGAAECNVAERDQFYFAFFEAARLLRVVELRFSIFNSEI